MKNAFCTFLLSFCGFFLNGAFAQTPATNNAPTEEQIYTSVEEQPQFPGGNQALGQFLGSNIVYPTVAIDNEVQGTVFVSFVVNRTGDIENVEVLKSVIPELDEEAVRVVKKMPRWKPGKQNGRVVKTRFTLPIKFQLTDE